MKADVVLGCLQVHRWLCGCCGGVCLCGSYECKDLKTQHDEDGGGDEANARAASEKHATARHGRVRTQGTATETQGFGEHSGWEYGFQLY